MSYETPAVETYGTVESRTRSDVKPGFSVPLEYDR